MVRIKKYVAVFVISAFPCLSFANIQELGIKLDSTYITTPNGTCGAYTALARPIINSCNNCCGSNWFAGASVLYWNAFSDEHNYAYKRSLPTRGGSVKGLAYEANFDWNWGYKVSLGYNLAHDGWETNLIYTNFRTSGCNKAIIRDCDTVAASPRQGVVIPGVSSLNITEDAPNSLFLYGLQANSRKKLNFRVLTWDLARDFFVSDCFAIRPFTALTTAWSDTKQETHYTTREEPVGAPIVAQLGLGDSRITVKDISRFRGIGPSLGMGLNWYMGCKLHLVSELTTGILCGKFKLSKRRKYTRLQPTRAIDGTTLSIPLQVSLKDSFGKFCPMIKAQVGLARKWYCNDDQNHVIAKLYFEVQHWWKLNYSFNWAAESLLNIFQRTQRIGNDVGVMGIGFDLRVDF